MENEKKRKRSEMENSEEDEYVPKVMLITGGCGFIGSHVTELMVRTYPECRIIVLDKRTYCSSYDHLKDLVSGARSSSSSNGASSSLEDSDTFMFVEGDITSPDLLNFILSKEKVDTVLHFAAHTHVDNSFGNSFAFTQTNVYGTHVLLEACSRLGNQIRRFMHVSTDEVYGENKDVGSGDADAVPKFKGFLEDGPLNPTNPYAATKAAAEYLVKTYHKSHGLPTVITRSNNVYGEGQFPEKLIGKFCNQLLRGKKLTIHGHGESMRSFLHVDDVARAYELIMRRGKIGEIYNIGGTEMLSVLDVANEMLKLFGIVETAKEEWLEFVDDRKYNDMRYVICTEKLYKLGWKELVSWKEGIKRTVEWYRKPRAKNYWVGDVDGALEPHPRLLGSTCIS